MHAAISETAVLAAAQSFITLGLREAGYEYVNIDVCVSPTALCDPILTTPQDCWSLCDRDPDTNKLIPDPLRFPRGIKALANDIHNLGLKIGIYRHILFASHVIWDSNGEYSDAGTHTCEGYPGSLGYEAVDAATWQSWDIDCELLDCYYPWSLSSESHTTPTRLEIW